VLIADDHQIFRDGLRGMLESGGMKIVGEAGDGVEAVALTQSLIPDVVVIDLNMPKASGLEVLRQIRISNPEVQAVVLTVSDADADVLDALVAGACGYLLKDTRVDLLASGIRQAAEGQMVLSRQVSRALMAQVRSGVKSSEDPVAIPLELTPREIQVLRLLAEGADTVAIGKDLSISPHTVKQYVANIFEKLGVRSRVQAAVYAVRAGLV
jgi:two-component system nitrate/nitrite response regulator NarL